MGLKQERILEVPRKDKGSLVGDIIARVHCSSRFGQYHLDSSVSKLRAVVIVYRCR